jgi:crotonobetainyl-CoA:carnitine CoA-transferase CaiB-like acyl-CoA transferase
MDGEPTHTANVAGMSGPLTGFTVIDATQMIAGPLASMVLADLGAEVVKVENPAGGDRMRYLGHRIGTIGALFANVNRGKRTIALDLTQPRGVELLGQLVASADVFVQNFRPGVAERLGIDEPRLRPMNERLVYVSISGFGETGPYVEQKSYDYVIQALTGMAALQADPDGDPALIRNAVVDKVTAYVAAHAITAALLARERSEDGRGEHVRLSMLDTALAFLWPDGMMQHSFLDDGVTEGAHLADNYMIRATKDGHIASMAISDRQFPLLCRALGTERWLQDPRFASMSDRERNMDALSPLIDEEFARYTTEDLVERLHAEDVPCAATTPVADVHLDPQIVHNANLIEHDRPWVGRVREPLPPIRFERGRPELGRHAPKLDEHTDEILHELGLSAEDIAALRAAGVVGTRR